MQLTPQAQSIFKSRQLSILQRTDRWFAKLLIGQWIVGIAAALYFTPLEWSGDTSIIHINVWASIFLGGAIASLPAYLSHVRPGKTSTRHIIAISQALFSGLLIHLTNGRIETHFHIFGSLAFLGFYRDWKVIASATIVITLDHFIRGVWWPSSVFGVLTSSPWRWIEHGAWVLFEDIFIVRNCIESVREMKVQAFQQAELENANERTEQIVSERTQQLRKSESRLSEIINHIDGIVWEADPKTFQFTFVSKQAESIAGYPTSSWTEDPSFWLKHLHPEDEKKITKLCLAATERGQAHQFEYRMLTASGDYVWLHDLVTVETSETGEPTLLRGVMIDINDRKKSEAELRAAKEAVDESNTLLSVSLNESKRLEKEAQSANIAKSKFLATMSHEIRTPMNGVIGFTNLLLQTPLNDDQRDFATSIENSSTVLLSIINDILDISKIEAGKLTVERIDYDLNRAIEEVADLLAPEAENKGIELAVKLEKDFCPNVLGDPGRTRQVITNIANNAIKFTQSGHVFIKIKSELSHENLIRVEISDTGIGISQEQQMQLFTSFNQADSSTTRRYGGTGLGLAISKNLVELMGGKIGMNSVEGEGSTFWFTIPKNTHPQKPEPINQPPETLRQRILVVDDHSINRDLIQEQLTHWSIESSTASTGEEALNALRQAAQIGRPYDIAILDYLLPDMNCEELKDRIISENTTQRPRLIALGSASNRIQLKNLLNNGFQANLFKPLIRPNLLAKALTTAINAPLLHKREATRKEPKSPATKHELTTTKKTSPAKSLKVLLVEDHLVNQKLAKRLLNKMNCEVDIACNGLEAIEYATKTAYDAIFMDCQMPEMGGIEATQNIRRIELQQGLPNREKQERIPIIAVTAGAMEGERNNCLDAGMDDYLTKPINASLFQAAINHWCVPLVKRN